MTIEEPRARPQLGSSAPRQGRASAVLATGHDRDVEVEIFNAGVWAAEPEAVVRETVRSLGAALSPRLGS